MIPNDCPPANPCNGTAPTAPPSTTDEHQYSAWYHHVKAGLDAWEIWQDLDDAGKLDVILTHYSATQWLNPEELAVLVQFRHQPPGRWAQIKLRYREIGGSPHDLQWEVDKLLKTQGAPQAPAGSVRPRFQTIPAPALYGKDLPPQDWVVQDILPVGATLFTGRGKDGKSLMAWNLCLAVATGGTALSHYAATAGDVLYLALEDGERRAQQRLKEQMAFMGTTDVPPTLELVLWDAPTIGDGFEEALTTWLDEHPQARLVVIDILEKIRPRRARNGSVYADDYAAIAPLQRLAQERGIAILIVHHSNKTKPDDFRGQWLHGPYRRL